MGQSHAIAGVWRRSGWVPARLARWWAGFAEAQEGRFILWLPVFMGAGVLAYFDRQAEPPAWIGAQAAAACLTAALASGRWPLLRAIALAAGFAALGFASAQYATARAPPIETDLPAHAVMLSGTVQAVETLPNGRRVTVSSPLLTADERPQARRQADRPPPEPDRRLVRSARFRLASGDPAAIATGDSIRVRAMLRQPAPPAYPGAWDTQRDAFFAGLGASGYALGPVDVVARAPPARLAAQVRWVREAIAARVMAVLPGTSGAVTVTLLTGDQRGIPEADHTAYRDSGLAHLLAVAGLHIGIVMGAVFAAARVLLALSEHASLFWPTKKIAAVAALAAGGAYMILTGAHVPIVRSFAMACLVTIALLAGRQALSIRGLGLAGIVLMTIAPNEVPGVSFQMSFSAVLALIAGYEALRPWLGRQRRRSRLLAHVVALALTSTLAGTASLPYGAFHFSHVQSYYILSNMAAVPLTAFWVMPAGLIALILMPFGLEALALVPMGWGVALITEIARLTASLPGATIAVPHIPPWGLAILSLGIAWAGIWRGWIRALGLVAVLAGLAAPLFDRPPDILVSGDGSLIGFRSAQGVTLSRTGGGSAFIRDAWLARWFAAEAGQTVRTDPAFQCGRDSCVFRPRNDAMAALWMRGSSRPETCAGIAVVVSGEPARGLCAWPPPLLADRFTVWKNGPTAIWLRADGATVLTDRQARGDRPWVPPPPKPKARPVSALPTAPLDR